MSSRASKRRRMKKGRKSGSNGSGSSESYDSGTHGGGGLVARFAQNPTIFGNVYRTVMKTMYQYQATGSTTYVLTWKANSTHLIGPQVGYTGSFGSASPTGLYNLLSSATSSGSTAPYNRYRIRSSAIRIFVTPVGTNTTAGLVACFPSTNLSFSSTTTSQFVEQPLCKRAAIQLMLTPHAPCLFLNRRLARCWESLSHPLLRKVTGGAPLAATLIWLSIGRSSLALWMEAHLSAVMSDSKSSKRSNSSGEIN